MKTAKLFIPLVATRWPSVRMSLTTRPEEQVELPLNCMIQMDGALFYIPAYLSLGMLRQDFPEAEYVELAMGVTSKSTRSPVQFLFKTNSDGRLITESGEVSEPPP